MCYFGNASWSQHEAMARIEDAGVLGVAARPAGEDPRPARGARRRPDLVFERLPDDRKNWILAEPSEQSPSKLRISTLSVDHGRLRYVDHGEPFELDVQGSTFDPATQEKVKDADARPSNDRYTHPVRRSAASTTAPRSPAPRLTGEVLSFQESGVPFPLKGSLSPAPPRWRSKARSPTPPTSRPSTRACRSRARPWPTSTPSCCFRCRRLRPIACRATWS